MLTLSDSTLPPQIDHFHSLVPLDTNSQKNAALFGYPSWIYKAVSSKDGNTYALRRLEGKSASLDYTYQLLMIAQATALQTREPSALFRIGSALSMATL